VVYAPGVTLKAILAWLERAEPWQARVLCASAAEHAAPLFRAFGRRRSMATLDRALGVVWTSIDSRAGEKETRDLQRLPEVEQDDSHEPEYYAGRMLEILVRALDHASTGQRDAAVRCLESAAALCDDIDVILTAAPGQTFRYDPKHPPPPGPFEAEELRALADVVETLREAAPSEAVIERARHSARTRAAAFEAILPRFREQLSAGRGGGG
jgi:hypothetical protein